MVDKACDGNINEACDEKRQHALNESGEKIVEAQASISLYYSVISLYKVAKIRDVKKLEQDIENDQLIQVVFQYVRLVISLCLFQLCTYNE